MSTGVFEVSIMSFTNKFYLSDSFGHSLNCDGGLVYEG